MHTFYGFSSELSHEELHDLYTYRHAVFIDRLGWDLPNATNNLEIDQFDRADTIYVGIRNTASKLCGCARLLPTNRPYLLGDVFPELLNGLPIPQSGEVWEVSRFAAVDLDCQMPNTAQARQFDIWMSRQILAICIRCAIEQGAKRLITVSPLGIERLLSRMGVHAHRAGPPMRMGEHALFACWIEIDEQTLEALDLCDLLAEA